MHQHFPKETVKGFAILLMVLYLQPTRTDTIQQTPARIHTKPTNTTHPLIFPPTMFSKPPDKQHPTSIQATCTKPFNLLISCFPNPVLTLLGPLSRYIYIR